LLTKKAKSPARFSLAAQAALRIPVQPLSCLTVLVMRIASRVRRLATAEAVEAEAVEAEAVEAEAVEAEAEAAAWAVVVAGAAQAVDVSRFF
jgi:regulator of sirC expression with transglutaminase-like and TPR domain